jgi:prepilin-type N-terminal cleavage/methylation domain-containing protein
VVRRTFLRNSCLPGLGLASAAGFSLLELLVAMAILIVALMGLAKLSATATRANTTSRTTTITTLLAAQKMEQLRALTWGFDATGNPLSDTSTDIAVLPPRANQGVGLSPSPGTALGEDTLGYCDFLDGAGRSLGGGASAPNGAIFTRRWSIAPLPSAPETLVLQVIVRRVRATAGGAIRLRPEEARVIGAKTRTAP